LWWVDLGWSPDAHQTALSLLILNRTGEENMMEKLIKRDKDREITHQLLSWAKQT